MSLYGFSMLLFPIRYRYGHSLVCKNLWLAIFTFSHTTHNILSMLNAHIWGMSQSFLHWGNKTVLRLLRYRRVLSTSEYSPLELYARSIASATAGNFFGTTISWCCPSTACDWALVSMVSSNLWQQEKGTRDLVEGVCGVEEHHIFSYKMLYRQSHVAWRIMMQKPLLSAPLAQALLIDILPETPTSWSVDA